MTPGGEAAAEACAAWLSKQAGTTSGDRIKMSIGYHAGYLQATEDQHAADRADQ